MSEIVSKAYRPAMACDRCCFGGPQHADWCDWRVRFVRGGGTWGDFIDPEDWRDEINAMKKQQLANMANLKEYLQEHVPAVIGGSDTTPTATASRSAGAPIGILPHIVGESCGCYECRRRSARTVNSYDHINGDWLGHP